MPSLDKALMPAADTAAQDISCAAIMGRQLVDGSARRLSANARLVYSSGVCTELMQLQPDSP